ncbi:lipopolysaccharide heptosyltransferase I [Rhodocyclus tenuis]|uniref:lipopolysaccharide heptosyltransferase I n=1 Tax=Rhodocyclus gracilis TaxID=2929842 RepID=UPI001298DE1A|nr:lipopolysaccharide heptosyltransferase I [Rhodocyclus gracilis]MRD72285.1 lipopolysaccharide heptosyltransferase I [Rhodocyclus gracilis]
MRILLIKTSSLGDVIHNLPVLSDLARAFPGAEIDWCVEEAFADIPRLHPALHAAIPVAVRRWRKGLLHAQTWREIASFRKRLAQTAYDFILDTQGLVKSALVAKAATGVRLGYSAAAAREPLAARFYERSFAIPRNAHAVMRNRWLAAAAFGLPADSVEATPLDYGIVTPPLALPWLTGVQRYAVLLSATSRDDKLWEEASWIALGRALAERGIRAVLPGGNAHERERAARLAANIPGALAAPAMGLRDAASVLGHAALTVGVDTGLVHLSAALGTPTLAIYTATDPALTGALAGSTGDISGNTSHCAAHTTSNGVRIGATAAPSSPRPPTTFVRNLGGKGAPPNVEQVLSIADMALQPQRAG